MVDHAAEQGDVPVVKQLFMEEAPSFAALRPKFAEVMARLCREMDGQETSLFPVLEGFLALHDPTELMARPARSALTETMSVSEVISRYPKTRGTFEALFVDRRSEGYDCLDEVAWRHGMESQELFTALEDAMVYSTADRKEGTRVLAPSGA